ncbi:MAG: DUF4258 domain-containing protein [Anaerolineales bacterium]|nr:DUF4258 domain-containing protein [Anaerolineales bacterium]
MREKVRNRQYVMTIHAEDEMNDDGMSIFDVESIIFTGQIVERQKDTDSGEWKYVIEGETLAGRPGNAVTKISLTGKVVFITVWLV